jgi:hypothetical protein
MFARRVAAAVALLAGLAASAQDGPTSQAAPGPALLELRAARTPAAAVDAYARAAAAEPDNPAVTAAFLRQMIDLNVPHLAEAAARRALEREPHNGVALAICAYSAAMRGTTARALDVVADAVKQSPREPFVQRTAGQLVAWYEVQEQSEQLSAGEKSDLQLIRRELSGRPAYSDGFREAREVYRKITPAPLFANQPAPPRDEAAPAGVPIPANDDWPYDDPGYEGWPIYTGFPYDVLPLGGWSGVYLGTDGYYYSAGACGVPGFPHYSRQPYAYVPGKYAPPAVARPGDNGPWPRPAPQEPPLFVGPGDKEAGERRTAVKPPPTWDGGGVRPPPPLWGGGTPHTPPPIFRATPGYKPPPAVQPGQKPDQYPPPGTKRN